MLPEFSFNKIVSGQIVLINNGPARITKGTLHDEERFSKMIGEWLLFNTAIPVCPVGLVMLAGWLSSKDTPSLFAIIRDGQLCFYCTATIACLMKDIIKSQHAQGAFGTVTLGFLVLLLIGSCFVYGIAVSNERHEHMDVKLGFLSIFTAITTTILVCYVRKVGGML